MALFKISILLIVSFLLFQNTSQNAITSWLTKVTGKLFPGSVSSNPDDIKFYLYPNPKDHSDKDELRIGNRISLKKSRLNPNVPIVILIHGFTQNYTSQFPQNVKNAYLQSGYGPHLNIIIVDWGKLTYYQPLAALEALALAPSYLKSANNVVIVGKRIEKFILFLLQLGYLTGGGGGGGDKVHLIGFSLGAHAAGMCGKFFGEDTGTLLYRITGLDPAGPSFDEVFSENRLNKRYAIFVDVIHTNAGQFGYRGDLGDVDIYVNGGGPTQPSCIRNIAVNSSNIHNAGVVSACSHNSAPIFYAKSISETMKACPGLFVKTRSNCTSSDEIIFGENCPKGSSGEYYIEIQLDLVRKSSLGSIRKFAQSMPAGGFKV